jgi:hypothetical protein
VAERLEFGEVLFVEGDFVVVGHVSLADADGRVGLHLALKTLGYLGGLDGAAEEAGKRPLHQPFDKSFKTLQSLQSLPPPYLRIYVAI